MININGVEMTPLEAKEIYKELDLLFGKPMVTLAPTKQPKDLLNPCGITWTPSSLDRVFKD